MSYPSDSMFPFCRPFAYIAVDTQGLQLNNCSVPPPLNNELYEKANSYIRTHGYAGRM